MKPALRILTLTGTLAGLALAAGCGGSSGSPASKAAAAAQPANPTTATASPAGGSSFSTAAVSGLGTVLVDGRGRTVYLLTSGDHHNVPCEDATGCTKAWPDLPLPEGVTAATAGPGARAALLGTTKSSDGETYPTYNGWQMYEFAGDSGPGQGTGQGIRSFGGTWYAITPDGRPVAAKAPATASPMSGGGYGY